MVKEAPESASCLKYEDLAFGRGKSIFTSDADSGMIRKGRACRLRPIQHANSPQYRFKRTAAPGGGLARPGRAGCELDDCRSIGRRRGVNLRLKMPLNGLIQAGSGQRSANPTEERVWRKRVGVNAL